MKMKNCGHQQEVIFLVSCRTSSTQSLPYRPERGQESCISKQFITRFWHSEMAFCRWFLMADLQFSKSWTLTTSKYRINFQLCLRYVWRSLCLVRRQNSGFQFWDWQTLQLYADNPVFLIPPNILQARLGQGDGFPGLWVDPSSDDGAIKADANNFSRWSIRPAGASVYGASPTHWKPSTKVLHDGDEVELFNHSYWAGGTYRDIKSPPFFAPFAFKKPDDQTIRVWKNEAPSMNRYFTDPTAKKHPSVSYGYLRDYPSWNFLTESNLVSELLFRDDHGRSSQSTIPGSDSMQMDRLRRIYEINDDNGAGFLNSLQVDSETTLKKILWGVLRWTSSHTPGWDFSTWVPERHYLSPGDFQNGFREYEANLKLRPDSLEALRLRIKFVSE